MAKLNCWEFMNCGKGPDEHYKEGESPCPAATASEADGIHDGMNGGRSCWVITGTHCQSLNDGRPSDKFSQCVECAFYNLVISEEGENFRWVGELVDEICEDLTPVDCKIREKLEKNT